MVKDLNKKKILKICLFLTLFGLSTIISGSKVSAITEWNLQVNGVNTSVNYSYDQLLAMPQTIVSAPLSCYGNLVTSGDWSGVSVSYLLEQTGIDPTVSSVNFFASDGYKVGLTLDEAIRSDVIIAYQLNGTPLNETLRLVMPGYNGNMWISMITSITMSTSTPQISSGNEVIVPHISNWQSLTAPSAQAQNTSPKNQTITEPTARPTNVTLPTQKTLVQQESNSKGSVSTIETVYGLGLGVIVVLIIASIALFIRRKIQKLS